MDRPLSLDVNIDEIIENFSFLDDWEDRYGYLIELGNALTPVAQDEMNDATKVQGCVSQVWLISHYDGGKLYFRGASDAHIVRGLVAIALSIFSGKTPQEIFQHDEQQVFRTIGLAEHLTPQRSNGLKSLVGKIKATAEAALARS
ncbi:MAG: cysteine desulfuration protein SufE [Rhizobiaceae bacterium]|nr:cysteine desulfuration protein SufE [Rhizobiaceae bacterium]